MPKRARQAHIPQQPKKRKARRDPRVTAADAYLAPTAPSMGGFGERSPAGPVTTSSESARRHEALVRPAILRQAGQLPTFERGYLVRELRQIGFTAGGLLTLILVLTLLLR